jgi:hypothetical protein
VSFSRATRLAVLDILDDTAAAVLDEWFTCTQPLVGDALSMAAQRFCSKKRVAAVTTHDMASCWASCLNAVIDDAIAPPYAADVLEYEAIVADVALSSAAACDARLAASRNATRHLDSADSRFIPVTGDHVRLAHFHFDAPAIAYAIEKCDRLGELQQPSSRTVLFVRQPPECRPSVMYITTGIEMLLLRCNGDDDLPTIIDGIRHDAHDDEHSDVQAQALAAVGALQSRNAISNSSTHDGNGAPQP